uniref:SOUL heme-binding protein n=1 Tax=Picea sitchensis TaxID=3332 RepID=A9NVD8_PICSI|nr:unknown [Picea sitchensis]
MRSSSAAVYSLSSFRFISHSQSNCRASQKSNSSIHVSFRTSFVSKDRLRTGLNSSYQVGGWNWKWGKVENLSNRASSSSSSVAPADLEDVQEQCSEQEKLMRELTAFLEKDLPHLFDEQGIDRRMYDKSVEFKDPITQYDSLEGYLFNIQLLRWLFGPLFELHSVKQTGPNEITTRWTMTMNFRLLPWNPELVFTGTSVMSVNPETGKFCRHVDYWDSIKNNEYFSFEGLIDVLKQLRIYKTPDLETPKYQILKRTADYEVRKYEPFIVVDTKGDKLTGSSGFNNVTGYIFGKNTREEKIPMTTPVFTQMMDRELSQVHIQIVLPLERQLSELPEPLLEGVKLKKTEENFAAVTKFSGKPIEEIVLEKENFLRSSLIRDGIRPKSGCMLARYNDPGRTWSFIMRNEVLIWLDTFVLE